MLTVIPLALALVAVIPFNRFERNLLLREQGITPMQKKQLMALRVFNHTAFSVIPALLEVLREENPLDSGPSVPIKSQPLIKTFQQQLILLIHIATQVAVESICAAVQYIPLWAHEIAALPEPSKHSEVSSSGKTD
jgi:hypothetical protein